jgi:hypothetical protein
MSKAVATARDEFEVAAISQELKLLPDFRPNVLISRIQPTEMLVESVNLV